MTTLARDVSNWSAPISAETIQEWKSAGVGLVLVQAFPSWYVQYEEQRDQMRVCTSQGMPFDNYVYDYLGAPDWLDHCLDGLTLAHDAEGLLPRMVWLDEEDVETEQGWTGLQRTQAIVESMRRADIWSQAHGLQLSGIYSGGWWWKPKTGNTTVFSERKLWFAEYDGIAGAAVFTPFGGWSSGCIKQYQGSQPDGTDLNVLSDAEEAELGGPVPEPVPTPEPCAVYKAALKVVVNRIQIEDERKTAAGKPAALRRTVFREIAAEAFAALSGV